MSWTPMTSAHQREPVSCCFCTRRAPSDPVLVASSGWQVRRDYPTHYRCPRRRRRQEPEAMTQGQ